MYYYILVVIILIIILLFIICKFRKEYFTFPFHIPNPFVFNPANTEITEQVAEHISDQIIPSCDKFDKTKCLKNNTCRWFNNSCWEPCEHIGDDTKKCKKAGCTVSGSQKSGYNCS